MNATFFSAAFLVGVDLRPINCLDEADSSEVCFLASLPGEQCLERCCANPSGSVLLDAPVPTVSSPPHLSCRFLRSLAINPS